MLLHGRRHFSILTSVLSLFFCFICTASAASAVLGIDLGTEYIKAALVKPGIPLEIVLTKDSKRKETAAVAFKALASKTSTGNTNVFPERVYGGDALALSARLPGDVFPNLKPLLGLPFKDSDAITKYSRRYPSLQLVETKERRTVGFRSSSFSPGEEPFSTEELLAMELKNIRANAVALAGKGSKIQDVVITIPSFFTAEERRAVTLAADLAGLRVLALISDGLSVGLNYATSRTFPTVNEGGKPEYHLVYDMGAGSATATVLRFQGRIVKDIGKYNKTVQEVQILGTGWDKALGGDALNDIILDDMIKQFTALNRVKSLGLEVKHVKEHGRTMAKLWKEAERIRQVLSANTETSSSFEGLYYEDVNFKYKLSRTDFEELASIYLTRVENPIKEALASAKLSLSDIESVILHGGTVRTPFIQKQLELAIGSADKVRTNVNSDEAAVFGAAFKAAGISPSFRVKEIRAGDIAGYAVSVSWSSEGKDRQQKLFVPTSQTGAEKQVSLKVTTDFEFVLYEQVPSKTGSLVDEPIVKVQTLNLTASVQQLADKFGCGLADISTKFAIRLSPTDGLPEVVKGSVSCEAPEKKGGVVDGVKDFLGFGSKKGDQVLLKEEVEVEPSSFSSNAETSTPASSKESTVSESLVNKATDAEEKPKDLKKTQMINVGFSASIAGLPSLSPDNLQRIKDRLSAFDSSDKSRVKREETLNTLEAFTYKARDLLEDEAFAASSTKKERTEIKEHTNSASEWLYGDGADASREILKARLDELHGLIDPIQKRIHETTQRPKEIQTLQEVLEQTRAMIALMKQNREAASIAEEAASLSASSVEALSIDKSKFTTPSPTSTSDDFADLDDDLSTSTSKTDTEPTTTSEAFIPPPLPIYSAEEIDSVTETQESVQKWLDEKIAEQEKLASTDDPVLLLSDLTAKSKELNQVVMKLLQRQMQVPPKPKSSKTKKNTTKTMTAKPSKTESARKAENQAFVDDLLKEMPGMRQITEEDLRDDEEDQKSPLTKEQTKEKAKEKSKIKSKIMAKTKTGTKKSKTKTKTKPKTKMASTGHEEL